MTELTSAPTPPLGCATDSTDPRVYSRTGEADFSVQCADLAHQDTGEVTPRSIDEILDSFDGTIVSR